MGLFYGKIQDLKEAMKTCESKEKQVRIHSDDSLFGFYHYL